MQPTRKSILQMFLQLGLLAFCVAWQNKTRHWVSPPGISPRRHYFQIKLPKMPKCKRMEHMLDVSISIVKLSQGI